MARTRMYGQTDGQLDRQRHAIICSLFKKKNWHIHTVIMFQQYFPIGYQVMACTRFVYTKSKYKQSKRHNSERK